MSNTNLNIGIEDLISFSVALMDGSNDGACSTIVSEPTGCCVSNGNLTLTGSLATVEPYNPWFQYSPTITHSSTTAVDNSYDEMAKLRKEIEIIKLRIELAKLRKDLAAIENNGKAIWVVPPYASPSDGHWADTIDCNDAFNRGVVFACDSVQCAIEKR